MNCPTCHGRKRVWKKWDAGLGIVVTYEDVCETCYGSGLDLGDENAWNESLPTEKKRLYY